MKNLLIYYFTILLPIPLMVWSVFNFQTLFVVLLLSYVLYRAFTDFNRLTSKGVVTEKDKWKFFVVPFFSSTYFKELYFEK